MPLIKPAPYIGNICNSKVLKSKINDLFTKALNATESFRRFKFTTIRDKPYDILNRGNYYDKAMLKLMKLRRMVINSNASAPLREIYEKMDLLAGEILDKIEDHERKSGNLCRKQLAILSQKTLSQNPENA